MSPFHRNDDDEGDGVCNINEPDKSKAATVDVIEDQALELDTSPDLNQMFREAIEKMWPCRDYEENLQNVINGKFELAPLYCYLFTLIRLYRRLSSFILVQQEE